MPLLQRKRQASARYSTGITARQAAFLGFHWRDSPATLSSSSSDTGKVGSLRSDIDVTLRHDARQVSKLRRMFDAWRKQAR